MKVAEDAGNAPRLRDENLALHKETEKIWKELDESRKTLEDFEARFKSQREKDSSAIRQLESDLRACQEEISEMDKHLFSKFYSFIKNLYPFHCCLLS